MVSALIARVNEIQSLMISAKRPKFQHERVQKEEDLIKVLEDAVDQCEAPTLLYGIMTEVVRITQEDEDLRDMLLEHVNKDEATAEANVRLSNKLSTIVRGVMEGMGLNPFVEEWYEDDDDDDDE